MNIAKFSRTHILYFEEHLPTAATASTHWFKHKFNTDLITASFQFYIKFIIHHKLYQQCIYMVVMN